MDLLKARCGCGALFDRLPKSRATQCAACVRKGAPAAVTRLDPETEMMRRVQARAAQLMPGVPVSFTSSTDPDEVTVWAGIYSVVVKLLGRKAEEAWMLAVEGAAQLVHQPAPSITASAPPFTVPALSPDGDLVWVPFPAGTDICSGSGAS